MQVLIYIKLNIKARAETNINNHEYLLVLVVFVKKNLVTNNHYIMLWVIPPQKHRKSIN